jgi:predicted nucleic acid-binding protein
MKLLLDTNIVIDILSKRDGYIGFLNVLKYCEARKAGGYISAVTVTDVMYILRKHTTPDSVRDALSTLMSVADVADITKADIKGAFSCDIRDFEDAVQAMCARRIGADYIVTRNIKDFENSPVRPILPEDMPALLF